MRKVQEYHLLKHSTEARKNWAQEQLGKKHSGSFMCLNSFLNNNKVKNNKLNFIIMPESQFSSQNFGFFIFIMFIISYQVYIFVPSFPF